MLQKDNSSLVPSLWSIRKTPTDTRSPMTYRRQYHRFRVLAVLVYPSNMAPSVAGVGSNAFSSELAHLYLRTLDKPR